MSKTKTETVVTAMPIRNYRTQSNYTEFMRDDEVNTLPSLTQPDLAMSVKEILANHTRGIPLEIGKVPVYNGDDVELPDPRRLDLSEIQELRELYQKEIAETKAKYQKELEEKKKQQDSERAEYKAFYDEWRAFKAKQSAEPQNPA